MKISDTAIQTQNLLENVHITYASKRQQTKEDLRKLHKTFKSTGEPMRSSSILKRIKGQNNKDKEVIVALLQQEKQKLEQEFKNVEELEQISTQNLQKARNLVEKAKNQESKAKVSKI